MRRGRDITWNGTTAFYELADLDLCTVIAGQMENREISVAEGKNQLDVIHELKLLGCVNVPQAESEPATPLTPRTVEQTSDQFRIPDKAVEQIELGHDYTTPLRSPRRPPGAPVADRRTPEEPER